MDTSFHEEMAVQMRNQKHRTKFWGMILTSGFRHVTFGVTDILRNLQQAIEDRGLESGSGDWAMT